MQSAFELPLQKYLPNGRLNLIKETNLFQYNNSKVGIIQQATQAAVLGRLKGRPTLIAINHSMNESMKSNKEKTEAKQRKV